MVADRVVAGSVYFLDRQQRSWLRCGSLRGQACDSGPAFLESGADAAVSVGVDADMGRAASCLLQSSRSSGGVAACCGEGADADAGRAASCLQQSWRSTGSLGLHATACREEAGMSEEAVVRSVDKCGRDVWNASRAHSSLSSRPSLHVSPHSVASTVVGVGLCSWSLGGAVGVRSWSASSGFLRAPVSVVGLGACRGGASRCVRFWCPQDRRGSHDVVSRPSGGDACAGGTGGFLPVQKSTSYCLGNSWSDTARSQGPTCTRRVKGGVSRPAEDLRPVSEVEAGVNFRPDGRVRGQVAGSLPWEATGHWYQANQGSVVTPSLHPEVPDISMSGSPGRRRLRHQAIDGLDEGVRDRTIGDLVAKG